MQKKSGVIWLALGIAVGVGGGWFLFGQTKRAAAGDDRHADYVITTGPVLATGVEGAPQLDAVYVLDYRAGKLLGTCVTSQGRIASWSEVDLVNEFGIAPRQDVHFLMTTGLVGRRSALYVAETTTGKFGVYTLAVGHQGSTVISRMDMVYFRPPKQEVNGPRLEAKP